MSLLVLLWGSLELFRCLKTAFATSLSILSELPFVDALSVVSLLIELTAVFLPVYNLFPDVPMSTRGALPGAVVAAVGWTLLQRLFQLYIQYAADPDVAGALGLILVLLVWLSFGSDVVSIGAILNHAPWEPRTA